MLIPSHFKRAGWEAERGAEAASSANQTFTQRLHAQRPHCSAQRHRTPPLPPCKATARRAAHRQLSAGSHCPVSCTTASPSITATSRVREGNGQTEPRHSSPSTGGQAGKHTASEAKQHPLLPPPQPSYCRVQRCTAHNQPLPSPSRAPTLLSSSHNTWAAPCCGAERAAGSQPAHNLPQQHSPAGCVRMPAARALQTAHLSAHPAEGTRTRSQPRARALQKPRAPRKAFLALLGM